MATAVAPLVVCVVGALAYGYSTNAKASELGRIAFFVGLMWLVYSLSGHVVRI